VSLDPYRDWLGITHPARPVDYYLLLGLPWFESDAAAITAAADRRLVFLTKISGDLQREIAAQLIREVEEGRALLLSSAKQAYDEQLWPKVFGASGKPIHPEIGLNATAAGLLLPPAAMVGTVARNAAPPLAAQRSAAAEVSPTNLWSRPAVRWGGIALGVLLLLGMVGLFIKGRPPVANVPLAETPTTTTTELPETPIPPVAEVEPAQPKSRPVVVRQEGNGELQFSPATARLTGNVEFHSQGTESILRNWNRTDDVIEWDFQVVKPDVFRLEVTYAAAAEWEGAKYQINISGEAKEFIVRSSGGADRFHTDIYHFPIRRNGDHKLRIVATMQPGAEVMIMKGVRLIPAKAGG
jgi:hypothetical protein